MKQIVLSVIAVFVTSLLFAQTAETWVRYYDTTTDQSGYKDVKGNIKIPAKFEALTRADTFYNIIAVNEKSNATYQSYYLLKNGKKVGVDSVYVFDFTADCENEEKIMFYSRQSDRVGFFDKHGAVVIPAVYNYVSPFRNGIAVAHRNAKRKCWGGGDSLNCEHWGWEGGETIFINDKNEVLADSVNIDWNNINWYSKKLNALSVDTSVWVTIKGRNNTFYSFIDFEKEFATWFYQTFLPSLNNKNNKESNLLTEITYWSEKDGWTSIVKKEFLKLFPTALVPERFDTNKLKHISIDQETGNPFMSESKLFSTYYTACGEHNRHRFPAFNVMLTYYKKRLKPIPTIQSDFDKNFEIDFQEHFLFLRTEHGYQLIQVSLRK